MELYQVNHLSFRYPNASQNALQNLNFTIETNDFLLLYGESGSGKTTLLRSLKKELLPSGTKEGEVLYRGKPIETQGDALSAAQIGYTAQNPDVQNVAQYVKHELAFLLRNLSYSEEEIALRVAQTVSFFGTKELYRREMSTLSGGEKQLVHLESLFTAEPKVLLLDEPLAQLDPFSTERFLEALRKIKAQTSVAIVIASHEVLPLLPLVTKVLYLEGGKGTFFSSLESFLKIKPHVSLYSTVCEKLDSTENASVPITVADCRKIIQPYLSKVSAYPKEQVKPSKKPLLEFKNVCFRYEKYGEDILSDLDFSLYAGEIFTIVGANGAGKSTLLQLISEHLKPYMGKIKRQKQLKIALVPQNPQAVFAFDSVLEILEAALCPPNLKTVYKNFQTANPAKEMKVSQEVQNIAKTLEIEHLLYQNPFDLSGGEQQRVALAKAWLQNPDVFLLDEGTKGLDSAKKAQLLPILNQIKSQQKAVLLVTHDLDFAADVSDRTALLFDGKLLGVRSAHEFFTENGMYTSTVAKIFSEVPQEHRPITLREVQYEKA